MGIKPMGDIISILRHAKSVNDQSVRDRILASQPEPQKTIVKVRPASPVSSSTVGKLLKCYQIDMKFIGYNFSINSCSTTKSFART